MKKLHYIFFIAVALLSVAAIQGCSKDKTEPKHQVSVDQSEVPLTVLANQGKFTITSKIDWTITAEGLTGTDGGWYTLSAASGDGDKEVTVNAEANPTGRLRTAKLTVKGKYNEATVTITQAADGDGMLEVAPAVLADFKTVNPVTQTFAITTPFEWTITFKDKTDYTDTSNPAIDPQWASVDVVDGKGKGDKTITVTAKDNNTGDARTGEFTMTAAGKPKTVTVNQLTNLNHTFGEKFLTWCLTSANNGEGGSGKIDTNSDGSISKAEAEAVTGINCYDQALTSIKGIENFPNLTHLDCGSNSLNELKVSNNVALTTLRSFNNQLTELDVKANTALTYLDCSSNQLTALDVKANTELTELLCSTNQLSALDLSANKALTELWCYFNLLTELDLSANTVLTVLSCSNNKLTTLDVKANTALTKLWFKTNQLTELDVKANTALTYLDCSSNQLTALDVKANTELLSLYCGTNPFLTTIDISGSSFSTLRFFDCTSIKTSAVVYVWSGFKIKDKPAGFMWFYPADINWMYTFDPAFLTWCLTAANDTGYGCSGKIDTNSDGSISKAEAESVTGIACYRQTLTSLKGIENFTKLTVLYCHENSLETLDVSKNVDLTYLGCSQNSLETLDVSKNVDLTTLDCAYNSLKTLDISHNVNLKELKCYKNSLKTLDVRENMALTTLTCHINSLETLDVSKNVDLTLLDCSDNSLKTLDVSNNMALTTLWCDSNSTLATINISGSSFGTLKAFNCTAIANNAKVYVWSGFDIDKKPSGSSWSYPLDVTWVLPTP